MQTTRRSCNWEHRAVATGRRSPSATSGICGRMEPRFAMPDMMEAPIAQKRALGARCARGASSPRRASLRRREADAAAHLRFDGGRRRLALVGASSASRVLVVRHLLAADEAARATVAAPASAGRRAPRSRVRSTPSSIMLSRRRAAHSSPRRRRGACASERLVGRVFTVDAGAQERAELEEEREDLGATARRCCRNVLRRPSWRHAAREASTSTEPRCAGSLGGGRRSRRPSCCSDRCLQFCQPMIARAEADARAGSARSSGARERLRHARRRRRSRRPV